MNVIAWARVSSREQREGYSIDAQLRAMRDRAAKVGWRIVREFIAAESAKHGADRVAFNEMFNWVKANARKEKIDAIFAHKLDRACRNMRDAVRLQELEDTCGVKLVFVENQFGPGAAGALSFNVMAAVAQYYSDNLRTEVIKGKDEKVRQGWPLGGAPYGYMNVPDRTEPVIPHPEKSKVLVRIFELYSGGKYTFESLADALAAEGHTHRPSQPRFYRTALSYILNNRFYIGELRRNGQVFRGSYRLVIDKTVFDACQDVLHSRNHHAGCNHRASRNHRMGHSTIMLAGGLLRCHYCGYAMTGELIRKKLLSGGHNLHTYYRCSCGRNHPDGTPSKNRWRERDVEAAILAELETFHPPTPKISQWFRDILSAAFDNMSSAEEHRKNTLTNRYSELKNVQDRLLNGYLNGTIDEPTFQTKSTDLKSQLDQAQGHLDEANTLAPSLGDSQVAMLPHNFIQNLPDIWRNSNGPTRRDILECISARRTLNNVRLFLTKRKPFDFLTGSHRDTDGASSPTPCVTTPEKAA